MTYGTSKKFQEKKLPIKKQPLFGPFKKGDPAHVGHNKTFGGHGLSTEYNYIEECEEDPIMYRKNITQNVWRTTS